MGKWSDTRYEKLEQNGIKFGKWVEKKSSTHGLCRLCNRELKFDQQGIQAFKATFRETKACRTVKTCIFEYC